jgi:ABC-2 type transport system ATP-binding protein
VIDLVDLTARIDDKVKTYSLGMRQRLGIAQAMLNNPRVLILDEPTNGLDPMGIRDLRLFIRRLVEETGLSVLVSSHILAEIELLADRVAIMSRGKIVKVGTVDELIHELASTVDVHVADSFEVLPIVRGFESIEHADVVDERTIRVSMNLEETARLNRYLLDRGVDVFGLERRVQTLEELFISLTGGDHIV